jgi:hypothetical protein
MTHVFGKKKLFNTWTVTSNSKIPNDLQPKSELRLDGGLHNRLAERTFTVSGSFSTTLMMVPIVPHRFSPKKLYSSQYTLFLSQYENIFQLISSTVTRNMSHLKSSRIETHRYRPIWLMGQSQYLSSMSLLDLNSMNSL